MQRSDARKRQAAPSEAGALTEAEREALKAAACGNCGERTAVVNLVARIKAEAVQAERERALKIAGAIKAGTQDFMAAFERASEGISTRMSGETAAVVVQLRAEFESRFRRFARGES